MNTNLTSRRRGIRTAVTLACTTALVAVPGAAHATSTHSTDDFDFDADGLCAFTVHLTVHNEADTTQEATAHGSIVLDHVTETDTVSANGVTVQGLPYHYTVHRVLDSAGNQVSAIAQGEQWRFRLPDGGVWSAGGRTDFLTGGQVGSWAVGDDLGPVCDALAG
jgi:hypothetical protein